MLACKDKKKTKCVKYIKTRRLYVEETKKQICNG